MKKRKILIFLSVLLSSVFIFSSASFNNIQQKDKQITYSVYKTTSKKVKILKIVRKASTQAEPYYSKQWSLNNDGTFVPETNNNDITFPDIKFPTISKPDFDFPDITDPDFNVPDITDPDSWDDLFDTPSQGQIRFHFEIPDVNQIWNRFRRSRSIREKRVSRRFYSSSSKSAVKGIDISAQKAWDTVGSEGRDVTIAVIDTGFDYNHEELSDAVWKNPKEIAGDGIDNDKNGYVDDVYGWDFYDGKANKSSDINSSYDHGTHVAGIMAAAKNQKGIAGIIANNKVKIMDLKALGGSDGDGETEDVIKAIKYAEANGATICNLSFGTTDYDEDLYNAIKNSKMLFVCAAGNGDSLNRGYDDDIIPTYPASFNLDNIISVANISYDGKLDSTSNYGKSSVDIAAPGSDIISSIANNHYAYMTGTSMAAPMVTAVAAMVYSYHKDYSLTDTKNAVIASVNKLDSLTNKVSTGGMLNAYNAVTYSK